MGPRTCTRAAVALLSGCVALLLGAGPAPAQGLLDANCPGPPNEAFSTLSGNDRWAQTFTAQRTGGLVRGEIEITKGAEAGGDWVMQIVATGGSGTPTDAVLASTTIADAAVPAGESRLAGLFAPPAGVGAGQQYGLLLTRPGADTWGARDRSVNPGPGQEFGSVGSLGGAWLPGDPTFDFVFAVFVKPSNAFRLGEITRNKKKGTATITVNVPYPGELTGSGNGVKAAGAKISKAVNAGQAKLTIRANGKKKATLNETGKVKVKPKITYTPTGGDPSTQSRKLKLKKNI